MRALWAAAALALAVTPGCKRRQHDSPAGAAAPRDAAPATLPQRVVIVDVPVRLEPDAGDPADSRATEKLLSKHLRALLLAAPVFVGSNADVPAGMRGRRARVEVTISYVLSPAPDGHRSDAHVMIQSRMIWRDGGDDLAPEDNVDLVRTLPAEGDSTAALVEQIGAALPLAAAGLAQKEAVRTGDLDTVRKALTAVTDGKPDLDLRIWALQVARSRTLSALTDDIIAMLREPSRSVRSAAIGALQVFGQRRAVKAIADATDMSDPQFVRLAIDAAATLGGDEARDFLEFLADGHPDADIRDDARRALLRMTSRAGAQDAAPAKP